MTRAEYNAVGNRTLTAAVAAANRTKLGSHGERLGGYDVTADLTTSSAYDMLGNNTSVTDGRGTTTTYTYDALSRLTGVSQPLSTGVTATTAYAYKAQGRSNGRRTAYHSEQHSISVVQHLDNRMTDNRNCTPAPGGRQIDPCLE